MRLTSFVALLCLLVPAAKAQQSNLLSIQAVFSLPTSGIGATVASPAQYPLQITNESSSNVAIKSITVAGSNPGDFAVASNQCPVSPAVLGPNSYCYVGFSFTPSVVGLRFAKAVFQVVGGPTQTVLLTGQGLPASKLLSFSPAAVAFGDTPINASNSEYAQLTLQNSGTEPLNIQSFAIAGANAGDFKIGNNFCGSTLAVGSNCVLYVLYSPLAAGLRSASLQVFDDSPNSPQSLPLTGTGAKGAGVLEFSPPILTFGTVQTNSATLGQLSVQDLGTSPVTLNSFLIKGPNASDFSVTSDCGGIPLTINPGSQGQCALGLQFSPSALGIRQATLQIADTASGSPHLVPLYGVAEAPQLILVVQNQVYNPVNFGSSTIGAPQLIQIDIESVGPGPVQLTAGIEGPAAADFSLVQDSCQSLTDSESCYVQVTFTPSLTGIRQASLKFSDSLSGKSQSFSLVGSGLSAGTFSATFFGLRGFAPEPLGVTAYPSEITFENQGSTSVTLGGVSITGTAAADFQLYTSTCLPGLVMASKSSCNSEVTFTPSVAGLRQAALSLSYTGAPAPIDAPLTGTGLSLAGQLQFQFEAPPPLEFGPNVVGASSTNAFNIANIGAAPVAISSISVTGANAAEFAIVQNQCPQAPATLPTTYPATCAVSIQFTPSAPGVRNAALQVTSNAVGSPQSLSLMGVALKNATPVLNVSNAELISFGPQPLGSAVTQSVTMSNVSPFPASISAIASIGPGGVDFTQVSNCLGTLSPSANCTVNVTFKPSVTGSRIAALQISSNAVGSPQLITLSGVGRSSAPQLVISPVPLSFDDAEPVGYPSSLPTPLTISNQGEAVALITGLSISGVNAGDFGIESNGCPMSPLPLAPAQSCQITFVFNPLATGTRVATLKVSSAAPAASQTISLVGVAVAPAKSIEVAPATYSFGAATVGSNKCCDDVTIVNNGNVPIAISSFQIGGANPDDFYVNPAFCLGVTLSPRSSCEADVYFTPTAKGPRSGTLTINTGASNGPQTVQFSGTGQ